MSLRTATLAAVVAGAAFTSGLLVANRLPQQAVPADAPPAVASPAPDAGAPQRVVAGGALPDLSAVAERALKSAANITSTQIVRNDPWTQMLTRQLARRSQSLGSGVVVDPSGIVLTNTHVVGLDPRAEVSVSLDDGRARPGRILGVDQLSDLAVIKIEGQGLQALPWADSSQLRVAEWVLAIGNPYQLSGTVTLGIVSTVNRSAAEIGGVSDFIQTDAAINPGNSGGALINQRGELVGINTMIFSQTGGYQGIGFAIPANTARRVMTELVQHGEVRWGSIGAMEVLEVSLERARREGIDSAGVVIYAIDPASSAARGGLREGDLIVAVEGRPVTTLAQLQREIATARIGSAVRIDVFRGDRRTTVTVSVIARESMRRRG
jgi:S1-C subfamily serine protease